MRIGLVSPYSFDVPGGVQLHVRDLADFLAGAGHHVSVIAPSEDTSQLPDYFVSAGRAMPIRYNGSVARLAFGPIAATRVNRWLEQGHFDVLHVHEPMSPSVSLLALWAFDGPVVATCHTSTVRSRAMLAANPLLRPALEKIVGRIAVSEDARRTVITHLGGDAVVIPNGVYVDTFARANPEPRWQGTPQRPTLGFLGRLNEPRKGLGVLSEALPLIQQVFPNVRVLVAGPGDQGQALAQVPAQCRHSVEFLGTISDAEKASLFRSVDAYVAPNTGGESFGIILVEALAAGAPVIASDLGAFSRVLDEGRCGRLFANGDSSSLARVAIDVLSDQPLRRELSQIGQRRAQHFDWSEVARRIMSVYETVLEGYDASRRAWRPTSLWR